MLMRSSGGLMRRLATALVAAGSIPAEAQDAPHLAARYEFDFRDRQFDAAVLVPTGFDSPYSMKFITPERRGLRIAIPGSHGRTRPKVGLFAALKLEGDLEITGDFDLVKTESPDVGAGVGANLYIMAEKTLNGATLRRCASADGKESFFVHCGLRQADGQRAVQVMYAPADARQGRLRLARAGTKLRFLVAEGENPEFRELKTVEFGADPIALVQLQAVTDGASKSVELYWRTMSIRADKLQRLEIPLLQRPPIK